VREVGNSIAHTAEAADIANKETKVGSEIVDQTISEIQSLSASIDDAANTIRELEEG
jgi:methyl-accepting chemotaxis protein